MSVCVGALPGQCATSDTLTDRVRRVQRGCVHVQNDTASRALSVFRIGELKVDRRIKTSRRKRKVNLRRFDHLFTERVDN